jgi:hypothetical protein
MNARQKKKKVDMTKFKSFNLEETNQKVGLLESVDFIDCYNNTLVQEFYSNLKTIITDETGPFFQSMFNHGVIIAFSLETIFEVVDILYFKEIERLGEEVDLTIVCKTLTDW